MAFTFNPGDLVRVGPPTTASPVGEQGLYIVALVQGANLTVVPAQGGVVEQGAVGLVIPSSRVTSHWTSA